MQPGTCAASPHDNPTSKQIALTLNTLDARVCIYEVTGAKG